MNEERHERRSRRGGSKRVTEWCLYAITLIAAYDYLAGPYGYGIPVLAHAIFYFGVAALLQINLAIHVTNGEPWRIAKFGQITRQEHWVLYWLIALGFSLLAIGVSVMGFRVLQGRVPREMTSTASSSFAIGDSRLPVDLVARAPLSGRGIGADNGSSAAPTIICRSRASVQCWSEPINYIPGGSWNSRTRTNPLRG
jgi:hypothetical protein